MKLYEDKSLVKVTDIGNKITSKELTLEEVRTLYAFVISLLKSGLPSDYYFGSYSEDRVCLYKNNNLWEVYLTKDNTRYGRIVFDDCQDACMCAINKIAPNVQMNKIATGVFEKLIKIKFEKEELKDFIKYFGFDQEAVTVEEKRACRLYKRSLSTLYKIYL